MQSEGVDESAPTRPGAPRGGIFLYEQVDVTSFFLFYRCFQATAPPMCVMFLTHHSNLNLAGVPHVGLGEFGGSFGLSGLL